MQNNHYYYELCKYTSRHKPGKYQHLKTLKHNRNVEIQNSNNSNNSNTPLSFNIKKNQTHYLNDNQSILSDIVMANPQLIPTNPKLIPKMKKINFNAIIALKYLQ